jgi:hypothetical protein
MIGLGVRRIDVTMGDLSWTFADRKDDGMLGRTAKSWVLEKRSCRDGKTDGEKPILTLMQPESAQELGDLQMKAVWFRGIYCLIAPARIPCL